ncbi:IST1-like protein [Impatiens glandulifera]|uniref:IST1-like protein n=1 Tax=Impatiens glandulifera TaxID=253017 RepID=UPI001FB0E6CC|nr:IST1-like protein [Impatiens glandulifera]
MTSVRLATSKCMKLIKAGLLIFGNGFNTSKCKTTAKMTVARIKLLRNKRDAVVKQMRRDIALLLQSGQDATARVRVEHVIREQNFMAANEFLELFCELIVARLSIIAKRRECPLDLKEGIASLIFAGPRCSDIPELQTIRKIFEKKYGKDFVSAATDLRPNSGVNRTLIEKLSVRTPSGEMKLKIMKEIAKEHKIEWDTTETEIELLKPPEQLIDGPTGFVSANNLPLKLPLSQPTTAKPSTGEPADKFVSVSMKKDDDYDDDDYMGYEDTASAARAAAEAAKKAINAAEAAAYFANKDGDKRRNSLPSDQNQGSVTFPGLRESKSFGNNHQYSINKESSDYAVSRRNSDRSDFSGGGRRQSDIKFDESEGEEEIEMEEPDRPAPQAPPPPRQGSTHPRVHPKLPDYEDLAARFEALKYRQPPPQPRS